MRVNNCVFSIISLKSNDFSSLTEMYGQLVNLKITQQLLKLLQTILIEVRIIFPVRGRSAN